MTNHVTYGAASTALISGWSPKTTFLNKYKNERPNGFEYGVSFTFTTASYLKTRRITTPALRKFIVCFNHRGYLRNFLHGARTQDISELMRQLNKTLCRVRLSVREKPSTLITADTAARGGRSHTTETVNFLYTHA